MFEIPALSLTGSAPFLALMSGLILYETRRVVRAGQTHFFTAGVTLLVPMFNLITAVPQLIGFISQKQR